MPSVLFVTTVDTTLEAFLLPFAEHLLANGWRVEALSSGATTNPHIADAFDARHDIAWSRNPLSPRNLTGAARRVRDVVRRGEYDLVWVHTPVAAWVTRFALRRARKAESGPAVIYTAHGFHFHKGQHPLRNAAFRSLERIAARWTDRLVTINQEDHEAAGALGLDSGRVSLIHGIGVDTRKFAPENTTVTARERIWEELRVPEDSTVVTLIAEFTPNKRHEFALDAIEQVRDPGATFLFVGDGPLLDAVRESIGRRHLADRVRLTGYRRDVIDILAASDLLMLCSAREGLNRSVLEAMACGIPVIGTATRGIADAIGTGVGGWIVPKDSAKSLAAAIEEAVADSDERARRGARARQRAVEHFSLDHVLAAYDALFAEVLASRSRESV